MPVLMYYSHWLIMAVLVSSFSYIPHTDHSEDVLKYFACWISDNLLLHWGAHLVLELVSKDMRFSYTVVVTTTQK